MSKNPTGRTPADREFDKLLRSLDRHQLWQVFGDFCELAALSFENVVPRDPRREQEYLDVVKRYEPDEVQVFPKLLAMVVEALEDHPQDFLGQAFMRLELSNHWHGQFFTPFELGQVMAVATLGSAETLKAQVEAKGFVSVLDPAVGAGCLPIALVGHMQQLGIDPQQHLYLEAWDLDRTAAHMTLIQLSLLHIPAEIVIGNSLSMGVRDRLHTPAYHLGLWQWKRDRQAARAEGPAEEPKPEPDVKLGQLSMFEEVA